MNTRPNSIAQPPSARLRDQDATAIVAALYRELVGREPDAAGLQAYAERLRGGVPGVTVPAIVAEMSASDEAVRMRVRAVLTEAARASLTKRGAAALPIVSLGTHCYTATLLKSAGIKSESYPFDWIFASPGMVAHCLSDDFAAFLDPRHYEYVPKDRRRDGPDVNLCDHVLYRDEHGVPFVFNHRNPLDDGDYAYLVRCVERFRSLAHDGAAAFLLATHDSAYFERGFELVSAALRAYAPASRLAYVVVTESSERVVPTARIVHEQHGHALVELAAASPWRALWFDNPLDDAAMLTVALDRT